MSSLLTIALIVVSALLIASILVQKRGAGLGGVFGGEGSVYRTKRGAEKIIFNSTIILGALFIVLTLASLFSANR